MPFGLIVCAVFRTTVSCYLESFLSAEETRLIEYLSASLIGLPVFCLLWLFRTYDTREQIQKSQEQIDQNELFRALSNLDTSNPQVIKIAVSNLIKIAKNNKNHHQEIQTAFIERLKQKVMDNQYFPIKNNPNLKLPYAQHILKWLAENKNQINRNDLKDCCFDHQEFLIDGFKKNDEKPSPFTILFNKEKCPDPLNLSFVDADLREVDLEKTNLRGANLERADLRGIDLSGTILKKANLNESVFQQYTEVITNSKILDESWKDEENESWKDEEKIAKSVKDHFKKSEAPNLYLARFFVSDVNKYRNDQKSGVGHYRGRYGLILEQDPPNIE